MYSLTEIGEWRTSPIVEQTTSTCCMKTEAYYEYRLGKQPACLACGRPEAGPHPGTEGVPRLCMRLVPAQEGPLRPEHALLQLRQGSSLTPAA